MHPPSYLYNFQTPKTAAISLLEWFNFASYGYKFAFTSVTQKEMNASFGKRVDLTN